MTVKELSTYLKCSRTSLWRIFSDLGILTKVRALSHFRTLNESILTNTPSWYYFVGILMVMVRCREDVCGYTLRGDFVYEVANRLEQCFGIEVTKLVNKSIKGISIPGKYVKLLWNDFYPEGCLCLHRKRDSLLEYFNSHCENVL